MINRVVRKVSIQRGSLRTIFARDAPYRASQSSTIASSSSSSSGDTKKGTKETVENSGFSHLRAGHIDGIQRHIFLCCDQSNPKCCSLEDGMKSWDFLKKRLRDLGMVGNTPAAKPTSTSEAPSNPKVMRTKADCVQVCRDGPIAVVYPEGTWYAKCSPEVLEEIIQSHLIGGKEYTPNLFKTQPLGGK